MIYHIHYASKVERAKIRQRVGVIAVIYIDVENLKSFWPLKFRPLPISETKPVRKKMNRSKVVRLALNFQFIWKSILKGIKSLVSTFKIDEVMAKNYLQKKPDLDLDPILTKINRLLGFSSANACVKFLSKIRQKLWLPEHCPLELKWWQKKTCVAMS